LQEQTQLGQYTLVRKLGEGGMAEVWEARHIHLGNRAAVKFLLPEFARNQEMQERFLNEGKRQAQLQHPNIVPAMDFFQVDGRSYLVMQYVEGTNLEARLQKENPPLTLDEIHSISWDVLSALDYAHSAGVVHRDVKPSNILIDKNKRVLLMDFGIALAMTEEQRVTRTGTSMGTPDYMSPEQITRPRDVDSRSDIYSFGCVLYAMLSGNPPFSSEGATAFNIQDRHVRTAPPPLVYRNAKVPGAVAQVVMKCLEKEPANRYQTCGAVMPDLDAAIAGKGLPAPPPPPPPPSPWMKYVAAMVVGVLLAGGIGYYVIAQRNQRRERLLHRDWTAANHDDPDFSDCMDVAPCRARKKQAQDLKATDWHAQPYNSVLFMDCMNLQPCAERRDHALQLSKVTDWSHADKALLSDCMGLQSCIHPPKSKTGGGGGEEPWPSCCDNASNPKACRAAKAKEGLPDCASPYGSN
jgi:serine/threonine-protein kinase